jgi:hypothetical protein
MLWPSAMRNRLLHFLILGGALFALSPPDGRRVELSSARLALLQKAQAAREGQLSDARRREVESRAIEDELLYREALRLSLDKGDPIVRQRLVQKLLLLEEDLGGASRAPSAGELRAYYQTHIDRFRVAERLHVIHVFARDRQQLPESLPPDATTAPVLGEAYPEPRDVTATRAELQQRFGSALAGAVIDAGGAWTAPVASPLGWHRARLVDRLPPTVLSFAAARQQFLVDFLLERRQKIVGEYLRRLAARYDVRIDGRPLGALAPTVRAAERSAPSAED